MCIHGHPQHGRSCFLDSWLLTRLLRGLSVGGVWPEVPPAPCHLLGPCPEPVFVGAGKPEAGVGLSC